MRGLTVVVASADPVRLDAALTIANAQAALGGRTQVFLHDAAVTAALPADLYAAAVDLGVTFIACQTALDTHGATLAPGWEGGGMVGLMAELGDDRLVIV